MWREGDENLNLDVLKTRDARIREWQSRANDNN